MSVQLSALSVTCPTCSAKPYTRCTWNGVAFLPSLNYPEHPAREDRFDQVRWMRSIITSPGLLSLSELLRLLRRLLHR